MSDESIAARIERLVADEQELRRLDPQDASARGADTVERYER
jgi:hypothetical protein